MCGIAGIIWKDRKRPAEKAVIRDMTDIMAHRGPDDEGYFIKGPVGLGHRRLSILDLSPAGHQPMATRDGRYVIVFNGEIYNYVELRKELEALGSLFYSHTDTEVILEAYRTWGTECVTRFNGMWAFALYDMEKEQIFFSRDRFGIKPLYYANNADCISFSSEIKGILTAFPGERQVNYPIVMDFLPEGCFDEGEETFFQNILSLRQAHNALYEINRGTFSTWRYWDIDANAFREQWISHNPVEALWELLESSVRLHMRSDVPVGTCLSGGLDSSTIVALMSSIREEPVYTFSGLYSDKDCDESEYVAAVNLHTGARACPVFPAPGGALIQTLSHITWHQDEPTAGPGLYTQYYVMKKAQEKVKVILDGQGGDELFAGYIPYFGLHIEDLIKSGNPLNWSKALHLSLEVKRHWGSQWLKPALRNIIGPAGQTIIRELKKNSTPATAVQKLLHTSLLEQCSGREITRVRPKRFTSLLENTLYWHLVEQSIPGLLHYEDRNSMAFSIEARVPLLDYRIVEYSLGLDPSYKIKGSWSKWVLRQCADRILPRKVTWRRSKMGYPTPFFRWLREDADREQVKELLFSRTFTERELVNSEALKTLWEQHQSGAQDHSWLLYRCITLELWFRHFIDAFKPVPAPSKAGAHG